LHTLGSVQIISQSIQPPPSRSPSSHRHCSVSFISRHHIVVPVHVSQTIPSAVAYPVPVTVITPSLPPPSSHSHCHPRRHTVAVITDFKQPFDP
jgi:hypothetical protein